MAQDFNYRFSSKRKSVQPNAAIEATSVHIPFEDEVHLENSGGMTDKCFFLKNKLTNEIYPWNEAMAADGQSFYLPEYNVKLLDTEEFADYKSVLVKNGRIKQVELENLLSPAIGKNAAAALVAQIERGDVKPEFVDVKGLSEVQQNPDLQANSITQVVEAAKRGRKPKEAVAA